MTCRQNDETVSIQKEMQEKWEIIGLQYMEENEKDLKDEMDFLVEPPKYYPNSKYFFFFFLN